MTEEFENKLFNRFNFYKRNGSIIESLMAFGFECFDGWFDIIWDMSEKIEKELEGEDKQTRIKQRLKDEPPFQIVQVKEKMGTLRVYANRETKAISEIIKEAEEKSEMICEKCGRPGRINNDKGWMVVQCDCCGTNKKVK